MLAAYEIDALIAPLEGLSAPAVLPWENGS